MNPNFKKISSEYLPTLDVTFEQYEHIVTKAKHIHLSAQNTENVFMVALRTMPHDSTGVAHILEHTALCGSKNFPVRDPFFGMMRRSVQTFMNAFTSSDWTAYPFATENRQDFDNLLRVYLDAVFFPNLDELDFMQEGHRFDFNEKSELIIKGVVYNEMKGVYENAFERIYKINKALLHPETTYHYESGGAPQVIPHLTYEDFRAFHRKHYHPTNATFLTFGDISASEHQNRFEELVLKHFDSEGEKVTTTDETRFLGPVNTSTYYPSTETDNPNRVHVLFSWLLDSANNAEKRLEAELVYSYLLGHSGSPLRHALENAPFAASVSPLSMLDDSGRELRLVTGIITDDAKYADECQDLVEKTLEKVIADGVKPAEAQGILDGIEMTIRDLNASYPYGLSLILQAIGAVTHEQDASLMLDPSRILEEMSQKIQNPEYVTGLIDKLLVKNPHRTRLVMLPSEEASRVEQDLEKDFCAKILAKMSENEKEKIRENAKKLEEHQQKPQNMDLLPKIALSDIPRTMKIFPKSDIISPSFRHYSVATNNIHYIKNIFPLDAFSFEEIPELAFTVGFLGELGFDGKNYIEAQKAISEKMSFGSRFAMFSPFGEQKIYGYMLTSGKFLQRNTADALSLFSAVTHKTIFSEIEQIRNIFDEKAVSLKSALTSSGHATAMLRASSGHSVMASISEKMGGIASMEILKNFIKKSDAEIISAFEKNYQKILKNPSYQVTIARENFAESQNDNSLQFSDFIVDNFEEYRTNEAWLADLAVGYCALSIKTVPAYHEDASLFVLLGQFLRDGYLHSAIREQGGAYGAGANYDSASQSFRFFSYRDPRIEGTFEDFEKSIAWLFENEHDEERLTEAKIGVIAKIDTPNSPSQSAMIDFWSEIKGYTPEIQNRERQKILDATIDDLKRIAKEYLLDLSQTSRVVITGKQNKEICQKMGFEIHELE